MGNDPAFYPALIPPLSPFLFLPRNTARPTPLPHQPEPITLTKEHHRLSLNAASSAPLAALSASVSNFCQRCPMVVSPGRKLSTPKFVTRSKKRYSPTK